MTETQHLSLGVSTKHSTHSYVCRTSAAFPLHSALKHTSLCNTQEAVLSKELLNVQKKRNEESVDKQMEVVLVNLLFLFVVNYIKTSQTIDHPG